MAKGLEARLALAEVRSQKLPPRCTSCFGPCREGDPIAIMGTEDPFTRCDDCRGPLGANGPMGKLIDGLVILKRVLLEGGVPDDLTQEGARRYTKARELLEEELEDD